MMQRFVACALWFALSLGVCGCSEQTQREAGEALEQSGEALESATEDAANVTRGAIEGASDALEENRESTDPELPE